MSRNGNERPDVPDPQVVPMARRRQFTAEEKLRFVEEASAGTEPGEIGALLRREAMCFPSLSRWRRARDCGWLTPLSPQQRGLKLATDAALAGEVPKLQRENERLQAHLARRKRSSRCKKTLAATWAESRGEREQR